MRERMASSHALKSLAVTHCDDWTGLTRTKARSSDRQQAKAISSFVSCVLTESRAALEDPSNQNREMKAKYEEINGLAQEILMLVDILFADYKVGSISSGGVHLEDQPLLPAN